MAAIELVNHLRKLSRGTARENLLASLQAEIEEDQKVLKQLLQELGETESGVRKTAAWLTEKLGQAKLKLDDPGSGDLRLLEALERRAREQQQQQVETERLKVARAAFGA
ncbi:MAG TPA: hypothetical protein VGP44_03255 [Gemmatimonadales bacterium]|nr:hypothetical protein [Gemmatimonadales bacterium]